MAADDFKTYAARHRIQQLDANRAQALADLAAAEANADAETAAQSIQELSNIEAQKQNIVALHEQYVRSQTPVYVPELTPEEKHAKPWDRMSLQDGLDLAKTSKYGKDLDFNDPNVIAGYNHMMANRSK